MLTWRFSSGIALGSGWFSACWAVAHLGHMGVGGGSQCQRPLPPCLALKRDWRAPTLAHCCRHHSQWGRLRRALCQEGSGATVPVLEGGGAAVRGGGRGLGRFALCMLKVCWAAACRMPAASQTGSRQPALCRAWPPSSQEPEATPPSLGFALNLSFPFLWSPLPLPAMPPGLVLTQEWFPEQLVIGAVPKGRREGSWLLHWPPRLSPTQRLTPQAHSFFLPEADPFS